MHDSNLSINNRRPLSINYTPLNLLPSTSGSPINQTFSKGSARAAYSIRFKPSAICSLTQWRTPFSHCLVLSTSASAEATVSSPSLPPFVTHSHTPTCTCHQLILELTTGSLHDILLFCRDRTQVLPLRLQSNFTKLPLSCRDIK